LRDSFGRGPGFRWQECDAAAGNRPHGSELTRNANSGLRAQSADIFDLERRMRMLERAGN
jgi:hypothetical protein